MNVINEIDLDEVERFVKNELVFIRKYEHELPDSLLSAFASEFEDMSEDDVKKRQSEIYEMYRLSTNHEALAIRLALNREAEVIMKAERYSIKTNGHVRLFTRGESVIDAHIDQFGKTPDEVEDNLKEWLYVVVDSKFRAKEVYPLQGHSDIKRAKEILDEYTLCPAVVLLLGFGILPNRLTLRQYLPRFLSLFYYDGRPIHIIQITNTETGKSTFAARLEFLLNYTSFSEFPSPARLIYDGRTGAKGAVFTSNGVVIDEIDKLRKERFEDAYQTLNTGLENGIWRRGVQAKSGITMQGYRLIPFILFGNILKGENPLSDFVTSNARDEITAMLDKLTSLHTYSFVERFAICDITPARVNVSSYLAKNDRGIVGFMKDSVMRGLISHLQKKIEIKSISDEISVRGRLERHCEAVYNVSKVLLNEYPDVKTVEDVVKGDKDVMFILDDESEYVNESRNAVKYNVIEDGNEYEIDLTNL